MICEGCIVQGFYPHVCQGQVQRTVVLVDKTVKEAVPCWCALERGCARWGMS